MENNSCLDDVHTWKWSSLPQKVSGPNILGQEVSCYAGSATCTVCGIDTWRMASDTDYLSIYGPPI